TLLVGHSKLKAVGYRTLVDGKNRHIDRGQRVCCNADIDLVGTAVIIHDPNIPFGTYCRIQDRRGTVAVIGSGWCGTINDKSVLVRGGSSGSLYSNLCAH